MNIFDLHYVVTENDKSVNYFLKLHEANKFVKETYQDTSSNIRGIKEYCKNFLETKKNKRWITPKIKAMFAAASFADFPILADACEDAGCTDTHILMHLRGFRKRIDQYSNHDWIQDIHLNHNNHCWVLRMINQLT